MDASSDEDRHVKFTQEKNMDRFCFAVMVTIFGISVSHADEPIKQLDVKPVKINWEKAVWDQPTAVKTLDEAEKLFDKEGLELVKKSVDFDKQIVLVFAWRGSGQDKLTYVIQESFPEQIPFSLKRGLTRDLKSHVMVYVLRQNVKWSTK
jgi:hypothetical protein